MEVSISISLWDGGWAPPEGFWTVPERMDPKTLIQCFWCFYGFGAFSIFSSKEEGGQKFLTHREGGTGFLNTSLKMGHVK